MFSSHVHGGKACVAEQKIREFKKFLFWSKQLHKATPAKHLDSRKPIPKAAKNINSSNLQIHGYTANAI